jgi:hypothetical protein
MSKGARSIWTLSDMPWYVTQRCALTPMAATLQPSTHTPVSPGTRCPCRSETADSALQTWPGSRWEVELLTGDVGCYSECTV